MWGTLRNMGLKIIIAHRHFCVGATSSGQTRNTKKSTLSYGLLTNAIFFVIFFDHEGPLTIFPGHAPLRAFCDFDAKFQKFKMAAKNVSEISTKIRVRPLGVLNLTSKFQTKRSVFSSFTGV